MAEFEEYATVEHNTEERLRAYLVGDKKPGKALTSALAGKVTRERIRFAFSELAALNVDNVHKWLGEVAQQSPAKAIELFMQLASYTLPQLKATAIDVRSGDGSVKNISYAELAAKVVQE
jgi:hypothetical protein